MNRVAVKLIELLVTPLGWILRGKRPGEAKSYQLHPYFSAPTRFELYSPAFKNGEKIPERHTKLGKGENISPELRWSAPPAETEQFLLLMEDIDAPLEKPNVHLAALFRPTLAFIPEGAITSENAEITFIPDRKGRLGYHGPRPFPGHGEHHYRFHLFALDKAISTTREYASFEELLPLVEGHVIAGAHLEGIQVA